RYSGARECVGDEIAVHVSLHGSNHLLSVKIAQGHDTLFREAMTIRDNKDTPYCCQRLPFDPGIPERHTGNPDVEWPRGHPVCDVPDVLDGKRNLNVGMRVQQRLDGDRHDSECRNESHYDP